MHPRLRGVATTAVAAALLIAPTPAQAEGPDDDFTPPTITFEAPGTVDGWSQTPFHVTMRISDTGGSGILGGEWWMSGATEGDGIIGTGGSSAHVTGTGVTTIAVSAEDRAGNLGAASADFGVDTDAPAIVLGPELQALDGAVLDARDWPDDAVADYSCTDAHSGVSSCTAEVKAGASFDPFQRKTLVITARDKVGRTSQRTLTWGVEYHDFTVSLGLTLPEGEPVRAGVPITAAVAISPQPDTIGYQWYRWGQPIPGATGQSYTPTVDDVDQHISYAVWPVKEGYVQRAFESPAWTVHAASVTFDGAAAMEQADQVGEVLTLTHTGSFTPSTAFIGYEWLRDGVLITDAGTASYTLTAADLGHKVTGRIRAVWGGLDTLRMAFTTPTVIGAGTLTVTGEPRVTGTPRVGTALRAVTPAVSEGAKVQVQWLRAGTAILGATGLRYVPGRADAGRRLTLRVTLSAPGYETEVRTATTGVVAKAASRMIASGEAIGRRRVKLSARVTSSVPVSGRVWVYRGSTRVGAVRVVGGRASVVLTRQPKGLTTFRIVYSGDAAVAGTANVVRVRVR